QKAPWDLIKENRDRASSVIIVEINLVRLIALLLFPIIPSSMRRVYKMIGIPGPTNGELSNLELMLVKPGQRIEKPEPIFKKLPQDFLERIDDILNEARKRALDKRPRI
ncbi:MAG: methionine--tRNA ligase, partial [Fervidicoccaceae archaeon]